MLLYRVGVYHYIIKVGYDEDVEVWPESSIDIALEGCGCVRYAKGHDCILVVPIVSAERHFPLFAFCDSNPMIGIWDIELGVELSAKEAVYGLADERQQVAILPSYLVKAPIVHVEA